MAVQPPGVEPNVKRDARPQHATAGVLAVVEKAVKEYRFHPLMTQSAHTLLLSFASFEAKNQPGVPNLYDYINITVYTVCQATDKTPDVISKSNDLCYTF